MTDRECDEFAWQVYERVAKSCGGGLSIRINEHLGCYRTLEDYVEEQLEEGFIDEAMKTRILEKGCIVEVQAYPDTPVGFLRSVSDSLEHAMHTMCEWIEQGK